MKTNKIKNNVLRQGDVLLVPINTIPEQLVKTKKVTLALGEVTGHHHTINNGAIGFAEKSTELCSYIEVKQALADLTHQEHETHKVKKGKYQVIRQTEYSPEELRNVAD